MILYSARDLPTMQNKVYATMAEAQACPTGDLEIVQDPRTGLIYNQAFRPDLVQYGPDYQNEQAHSPTFQRHLEAVADILDRRFPNRGIWEVGCGKGRFLALLRGRGFEVRGLDPAYEGNYIVDSRKSAE